MKRRIATPQLPPTTLCSRKMPRLPMRQSADGDIGEQIGLPEMRGVQEQPDQAGSQRDHADHQRIALHAIQLRAESVGGRH